MIGAIRVFFKSSRVIDVAAQGAAAVGAHSKALLLFENICLFWAEIFKRGARRVFCHYQLPI